MKFKQLPVIQAEYKITTPLFLGGALDAEVDAAHFRNASFKGALRFWWRAIHWGNVLTEHAGDHAAALKALHQRESKLFGHASDGKDAAQSQSLLQITSRLEDTKIVPAGANLRDLDYLLGLGLWRKPGTLRPYLSGGRLRVDVRLKPSTTPAQIEEVAKTMTAMGIFGGLGSRARKGMGSMSIQWIDYSGARSEFAGVADIQAFISTLDFGAPADAPLSSLNCMTRIDLSLKGSDKGSDANELLKEISKEQELYRSYGRNGKVKTEPARRNFTQDHDCVLDAINGKKLEALPQRAVFGLPHNYFYSSNGISRNIIPAEDGRRASPLFVHIHAFPSGLCIAIQTVLQGMFLPETMDVEVKDPKDKKQKKGQKITNLEVDFQVIHRYLDGFPSHEVLRNGR